LSNKQESPSSQKSPDDPDQMIVPEEPTVEGDRKQFTTPEEHAKHLENEQFSQDMGERKRYALMTFVITGGWVLFIMIVTLLEMKLSIFQADTDWGLTETQYVTLITASTTAVLGMWGFVGAYLFWRKS